MSQYNVENYNRVRNLANALPWTGLDGEYDIYHYNIFGESGSFIIKSGVAELLNHTQPVSITVLSGNETGFCVTRLNGTKYYFGQTANSVERSSYNNENQCDQNALALSNIATGWFLNKIESPSKRTVTFNYDLTNTDYIYDTRETATVESPANNSNDVCPEYAIPSLSLSNVFCVRFKNSKTPLLTSVYADNFNVSFDYTERLDLPGDKLLNRIKVYNSSGTLSNQVDLNYFHSVAITTLEDKLDSEIGNYQEYKDQILNRYFLTDVSKGLIDNKEEYKFDYFNKSELPHRFSFSQDLFGYYNGKSNPGILPSKEIYDYINSYLPNSYVNVTTGNREIDTTYSKYGLLKEIIYPTKGTDAIYYESNSVTTPTVTFTDLVVDKTFYPPSSIAYWVSSEEFIEIPANQNIILNVSVDYNDLILPPDWDYAAYFVEFVLWDLDNEIPVIIPGADANGIVHKNIFEDYSASIPVTGGTGYQLYFYVYNYKTYFSYNLKYKINPQTILIEKPYSGNRVSKIVSNSNDNTITKFFSYKNFTKIGKEITFQPETSIEAASDIEGYANSELIRIPSRCGSFPYYSNVPESLLYHYFNSSSAFNLNYYSGLPYVYKFVTEFQDSNKNSFIASEYKTSSNESGGVLIGEYTPNIPLSNLGWENGLESKRYYGKKYDTDKYEVKKELNWNYSVGSSLVFDNYKARKKYDPVEFSNIYDDDHAFAPYILMHIPLYKKWYKLNDEKEISYESESAISVAKNYQYNTINKLVSKVSFSNSKQESTSVEYERPQDMITNVLDPSGVYAKMVAKYNHEPVVFEKSIRNGQVIANEKTTFYEPYTDIFVPQSIETWTNDPSVKRRILFTKYDSFNGNLLSYKEDDGVENCILWSYDNLLPVAKIKNISYSSLESLLGVSILANIASVPNPPSYFLKNYMDIIRNASANKNSLITTYTYKPLVGMTSMTDPAGRTTYYEYDGFQRLRNVKDMEGNILKHTDYHYKDQ